MQRLFLVTALVLVTAPVATGAQPGQDGGGWQMWEYRATGLKTAMEQADLHLLDVHCTQVGRVLTRSGVRFPTWAHSLRTACAAVRNIFEPIGDRRRYRLVCHDLKQAAKDLGKARAVPEAPAAAELALQLSAMIGTFRTSAC